MADSAAQAATAAQHAVDKQATVIKEAEAALAAANDALAKAVAMKDELPKKLPATEAAITAAAAAAATNAQALAVKAAEEIPPLKSKQDQLAAEYQKLKPKG